MFKEYIKQLRDNNLFDAVFTDIGLSDDQILMVIHTLADKSENESLFVVPGFLCSDSVNQLLQPQQIVQQCDLRIQGLEQIPPDQRDQTYVANLAGLNLLRKEAEEKYKYILERNTKLRTKEYFMSPSDITLQINNAVKVLKEYKSNAEPYTFKQEQIDIQENYLEKL